MNKKEEVIKMANKVAKHIGYDSTWWYNNIWDEDFDNFLDCIDITSLFYLNCYY